MKIGHEDAAMVLGFEGVSPYEFIRDTSMRLELEWRPKFAAAFPLQRGMLPTPLI
jgi:hypothetical protein